MTSILRLNSLALAPTDAWGNFTPDIHAPMPFVIIGVILILSAAIRALYVLRVHSRSTYWIPKTILTAIVGLVMALPQVPFTLLGLLFDGAAAFVGLTANAFTMLLYSL